MESASKGCGGISLQKIKGGCARMKDRGGGGVLFEQEQACWPAKNGKIIR